MPPVRLRVLVAEHEDPSAQILAGFLRGRGHQVRVARSAEAAARAATTEPFDVALVDAGLDDGQALSLVEQLVLLPDPPEVLLVSGAGGVEATVAALRLGAFGTVARPYRMPELEAAVRRAAERRVLTREVRRLRAAAEHGDHADMGSAYPPLQAVLASLAAVVPGALPVLVEGPRGTGKRTLARCIHRRSQRTGGLIEVDGGAPGACVPLSTQRTQPGSLLVAHVDALSAGEQLRLLDALDSAGQLAAPDGASGRVLATVTGSVTEALEAGRITPRLVEVLGRVRVALPQLQQRLVDLDALAEGILRSLGVAAQRLTHEARQAMEAHDWPGNIRELRLALERGVLSADGGRIGPAELGLLPAARAGGPPLASGDAVTLQALERAHIAAVLCDAHWHQGRAADILGISPKTLYRKIREYGLQRPTRP
jgi:DNA-binding NtrC family response regulator